MRWLCDPDAADLLRSFPAKLMTMWSVARGVDSPKSDRAGLLEAVEDALAALSESGEVERRRGAIRPGRSQSK